MSRPLLFLDVDGPLIPFGGLHYASSETASNPLLGRLNPEHGRRLLALPCELVWATSWMDDANIEVAPRIGLPKLPVVVWSDSSELADDRLHWKTRDLVEWAAGRPFVWADDEITDADRAWYQRTIGGRALLHRVDPHCGMTDADFDLICQWLERLSDPLASTCGFGGWSARQCT